MKSIKKAVRIEFEEKKSKFIGYAKPISSKEEAEDFIDMIREMHPDATHNCTVYRVIDSGQEYFKADDDGEPKERFNEKDFKRNVCIHFASHFVYYKSANDS